MVSRRCQVDVPGLGGEGPEVFKDTGRVCGGGGGYCDAKFAAGGLIVDERDPKSSST